MNLFQITFGHDSFYLKKNKLILIGNMEIYPQSAIDPDEVEEQAALVREMKRPPAEFNNIARTELRSEEEPSKSVIRRYFPETWIWNLHFLE